MKSILGGVKVKRINQLSFISMLLLSSIVFLSLFTVISIQPESVDFLSDLDLYSEYEYVLPLGKQQFDTMISSKQGIFPSDRNPWHIAASIQEIDFDKANSIWIGTKGVLTFQKDGSSLYEWRYYDTNSGLIHNYVHDIDFDRHGSTFIATQGGISVLDSSLQFHNYTTADGLTENNITTLQVNSSGDVFCGTHNGFLKLEDDDTWSIVKSKISLLKLILAILIFLIIIQNLHLLKKSRRFFLKIKITRLF